MRKIVSIIAILLSVLCLFPMNLSAVETGQPVIWVENPETGYEEYTDSLGNVWMTLTIDEDGNRLIISKDILGVVEFEDDFNHLSPDYMTVYDDYATSTLKEEMDTFYNGGDAKTKINDTVYYLAPELKAIAQPVVLPTDEVVTFAENDPNTELDEHAYAIAASGGLSYVDESGETTCFALSATEMFKYLTPEGTPSDYQPVDERIAEHSEGSNYASTGESYSTTDNIDDPNNPIFVTGGHGWSTRSSSGDQNVPVENNIYAHGFVKVTSSGQVGTDYVDINQGFRPALWVGEADTDMDGITDEDEVYFGYDPLDPDMDNDGLLDGEEVGMKIDPKDPDVDNDGLLDGEEVALETNPSNIDSDGDKVDDFEEVNLGQDGYITNPLSSDTDNDGLDDRKEAASKTDPTDNDTDNDGLIDGTSNVSTFSTETNVVYGELDFGTDPLDSDSDDDGLDDSTEAVDLGTEPLNDDSDHDGVIDGDEVALGINPISDDSDHDGVIDGEEVALGLDPLSDDSDHDGITDGEEIALGTDPMAPNSDIDEVTSDDTDQEEVLEANAQEETLEETGSVPFTIFFIIAVIAFLFALYTRFRNIK